MITSFVIRFVTEQPTASPAGTLHRGTIRHIQSNREIPFTRWEEAVTFIEQYINLRPQESYPEG